MKKLTYLFIALLFITASVNGQEIKISDIDMNNLGDGRLFGRDKKEKPINGRVRIITGYTTEYIDAGFSKGLAEGKWEYYRNNKLAEVMNYSDGLLNGELIRYYSDGETVKEKGNMKNGKADGVSTMYSSEGKLISEKGMKDGIEDGLERRYDEKTNEIISETIYKAGKPEGKSFSKINKGSSDEYTKTEYYKGGKRDGVYSEIYADGTVKTRGNYIDGQKDGLWENFKKDGTHKGPVEVFKNGKVIKKTTYYTDGSIEMESNFNSEGKKHGIETKYAYDGGHITSKKNFINGKQVGEQMRRISSNQGSFYEYAVYNESGKKDGEFSEVFEDTEKVKSKGQFVNDKKHGKWVYGLSSGKLYKEEIYDNGKLIETKSID